MLSSAADCIVTSSIKSTRETNQTHAVLRLAVQNVVSRVAFGFHREFVKDDSARTYVAYRV